MRQRKVYWATIYLMGLVQVNACRPIQTVPETQAPREAVKLVRDYLYSDDQEANRLLPTLSGRPIAELESALRVNLDQSFQEPVPTGKLPGQTIRVGSESMSYGLYVPATYEASRPYPLIICLHGLGFDGDTYLDRWEPRVGKDYIVACPTHEEGDWWTRQGEDLILAVLSAVSREYHVDLDRVFLTGMSNGGIGTFLIGLNHPDRFAALIPMAAVFPSALFPLLDNARNLPIYLIHGAKDQVMPVQYSRDVAAYLEQKGYQVVYREHEREHPVAGGHFFPKEELADLLVWLKTQHRFGGLRELVVVRDRDHPGRAYWIRINQIAPEAASFWESEHDRDQSRRLKEGAYARITAKVTGNTFFVTSERVVSYTLLLNRDLVDLGRQIRVVTNGRTSFERLVQPDASILLKEARERPDPHELVLSAVEITVPP